MNLRPHRRRVPTIPIVSLIDIMLVLLIFFVATTTFKKKETHVAIAVPQSPNLGTSAAVIDQRTTIAITAKNDLFLDGTPVLPTDLIDALKKLKQTRPNAKLELEADTTSDFGSVVKAMSALTAAGFELSSLPVRLQRTDN
jgi:biopolymer transport protein ExbD